MHHCLHIEDIIRLICDKIHDNHQYEDYHDHAGRNPQLYAMAQTCKDFHMPALEKLWETVYHLDNIVKCAGRDIWKVEREIHGPRAGWWTLSLARPISPSDLKIMRRYTSLVRHIRRCETMHTIRYYPSLDVWRMLEHTLNGTKLFANLRSVYNDYETIMSFPELFGAQNITSLTAITFPTSSMLLHIAAQCPGLTSIELGGGGTLSTLKSFAEALLHWWQLSRVSLFHGTPDILRALSMRSSSLKYLRVDHFFTHEDVSNKILSPTGVYPPFFPILEALHIGIYRAFDAVQLIDFFPATNNLQSLVLIINHSEQYTEGEWLDLFQSFKKHSQSLKELVIEYQHNATGFREATALSSVVLSTLSADFSTLTHIRITSQWGYNNVDEDVKHLTEALPLLEEFCLFNMPKLAESSELGFSIACLLFFAKSCPSLSRLALTLDSRGERVPQELGSVVRGLNLRWLDLSFSPISNPQSVAWFLSRVFPNLRYIVSNDAGKLWAKVGHLLSAPGGVIEYREM